MVCMSEQWIVGVDEVGRGPLAGPVAVGVFAVPNGVSQSFLKGIKDSKKLSGHAREEWARILNRHPEARSAVAMVGANSIDTHGIVQSIQIAMRRALQRLDINPINAQVLLDGGLHAPDEYTSQRTIIKGDNSIPVISAAAILAKVRRDDYMTNLARRYPEYAFEQHKGYGTKQHRDALARFGLSDVHRRSFCTRLAH